MAEQLDLINKTGFWQSWRHTPQSSIIAKIAISHGKTGIACTQLPMSIAKIAANFANINTTAIKPRLATADTKTVPFTGSRTDDLI